MCFEGRRNQSNKKMVEHWECPGALYGGTVFQETSRMSNILGKGKQDYGVFLAAGGNLSQRGVMGEKEGNVAQSFWHDKRVLRASTCSFMTRPPGLFLLSSEVVQIPTLSCAQ